MQNRMKCIVHIGTEKTGTTTIQDFLYHNRELLKQKGYGVISSVGKRNNRGLAGYAMRDDRSDDYLLANGILTSSDKIEHDKSIEKVFEEEVGELSDSCHTILITSEHFHSRCIHPDEIDKLKLLLEKYFEKIDIIVYLRPQVDVVTSLYSTYVRAGGTNTFDDFVLANCTKNNPYFNYDNLLSMWSASFGEERLVPRIFDKKYLLDGDLINDFLSCMNLDGSNLQGINKSNESLTPFGQELLRLNNIANYTFNYEGQSYKQYIYEKVNSLCIGKGCSLSSEKAYDIQKIYHDNNISVAKKWFNKHNLFDINFEKYREFSLDASTVMMLNVLFFDQEKIHFKIEDNKNSIDPFGTITNNLLKSTKKESADILREVAFAFEKAGDIETAYKLIKQAHYLRSEGPTIKQKLDEYKYRLKNKEER
ncbi:MAG: hypothetical protein U9N59_00705 [Campylobacterota bacterium]|nr:hypothetical protein [Campylobacterota bacterium]